MILQSAFSDRRHTWKLAVLVLLVLAGCGREDARQSLQGTVTLDGKPLEKGYIQFRPLKNTISPTSGAKIADGRFLVSKEGGPHVGKFRVEITAVSATGRKVPDVMTGAMVGDYRQCLPARYNEKSELQAEVIDGGPNQYEFALTSDMPD